MLVNTQELRDFMKNTISKNDLKMLHDYYTICDIMAKIGNEMIRKYIDDIKDG